jgi:hypothetical protein
MGRNNGDFVGGTDRPVYSGRGLAGFSTGLNWETHALASSLEARNNDTVRKEPGRKWGKDVALVPVHQLKRYREFDRLGRDARSTSEEDIAAITADLRRGGVDAIREPVSLEYNHEKNWAFLGEGHHRLEAAIRAGISHIPLRIQRQARYNMESHKKAGKGAPLNLDRRIVEQDGYYPANMHPGNFQEFEGAR